MILRNGPLLALTSILVACGGDDSKDSLSINKSFETSMIEPSLTAASASEGLTVLHNSEITGSLEEGESVTIQYSSSLDSYASLVVLNSEAKNFDLEISAIGSNYSQLEDNLTSFEMALIDRYWSDVIVDFLITVTATEGAGDFTLKITDPNKTSLGLSEDDYLFITNTHGRVDCFSGSYLDIDDGYMILNFEDEYAIVDGYKTPFYAKGSEISVGWSNSFIVEEGELHSIESPESKDYTLSFEGGYSLSGVLNWSFSDSSENDHCEAELSLSGSVIL